MGHIQSWRSRDGDLRGGGWTGTEQTGEQESLFLGLRAILFQCGQAVPSGPRGPRMAGHFRTRTLGDLVKEPWRGYLEYFHLKTYSVPMGYLDP